MDWAAASGNTELIKILLENGADIESGKTGIRKTFTEKHISCSRGDFATPLYHACSEGWLEAAGLLISKGADVGALARYKRTPLHGAARSGNEKLVLLLLENKADPTLLTTDGKTPSDMALNAKIRQILEKHIKKNGHVKLEK